MGRRVLRGGGHPAPGFTLIEIMVAMAIGITVMLANLFLFGTASRNLAAARELTEATNLAARTIATFRSRTIAQIEASAPTVQAAPNPLGVRTGTDTVTAGGISFTRTWVVSHADLEADGAADLVGDVVKVRLEVSWTSGNRPHAVTMTTFATGAAP